LLKSKFIWNKVENSNDEPMACDLHPEIQRLFLARGLGGIEALKADAKPSLPWHDPNLFKDMANCLERIKRAIGAQERILIYGDYDADGITSTVILMRAIKSMGGQVDYYVPHRFFEGYGPNEDAFMSAVGEGYQLVITVDCGIASILESHLLKAHGVDLIVVDHHHWKEELPEAVGIVHAAYDENYPFDDLAGVGTTLKLVEALKEGKLDGDDYVLAMLGTIGDVVPLTDENRTLVMEGLKAIKQTTLPGLLALLKVADLNPFDLDETDVGFSICPRLNAPGRMDDASLAIDLLLSDDEQVAEALAKEIEGLNNERKSVTKTLIDEAISQAKKKFVAGKKALVLYDPNWHEGVLGIAASKVVDTFGTAVALLTDSEEGFVKGSARAPAGFDLLGALEANADLMLTFGGHAVAAGLSLEEEAIEPLEEGLNAVLASSEVAGEMAVDLELSISEVDLDFLRQMEVLAPFGQGNKRPVVKLTDVEIIEARRIGKSHEHLKFVMKEGEAKLDAVFFGGAGVTVYLTPDARFDLLCELDVNEWNGNRKPQARIVDMRCDHAQLLDLRNQKLANEFAEVACGAFVVDDHFESKAALKLAYQDSGCCNVVLKKVDALILPTREQFGLLFKTLKQHAPFRLNREVIAFFERGGVREATLTFMVQVFVEVGIVTDEAGQVALRQVTEKVAFTDSKTYQTHASKVEVCEFLDLADRTEILAYLLGQDE